MVAEDVGGAVEQIGRELHAQVPRRHVMADLVEGVVHADAVGLRLKEPAARLDSRSEPIAGVPGAVHGSSLIEFEPVSTRAALLGTRADDEHLAPDLLRQLDRGVKIFPDGEPAAGEVVDREPGLLGAVGAAALLAVKEDGGDGVVDLAPGALRDAVQIDGRTAARSCPDSADTWLGLVVGGAVGTVGNA